MEFIAAESHGATVEPIAAIMLVSFLSHQFDLSALGMPVSSRNNISGETPTIVVSLVKRMRVSSHVNAYFVQYVHERSAAWMKASLQHRCGLPAERRAKACHIDPNLMSHQSEFSRQMGVVFPYPMDIDFLLRGCEPSAAGVRG